MAYIYIYPMFYGKPLMNYKKMIQQFNFWILFPQIIDSKINGVHNNSY